MGGAFSKEYTSGVRASKECLCQGPVGCIEAVLGQTAGDRICSLRKALCLVGWDDVGLRDVKARRYFGRLERCDKERRKRRETQRKRWAGSLAAFIFSCCVLEFALVEKKMPCEVPGGRRESWDCRHSV